MILAAAKKIVTLSLTACCVTAYAQVGFEDRTGKSKSGVDWDGKSYGLSWGDYDGDGYPDLFLANHTYVPKLYRNNRDGTFTETTASVLVERDNEPWDTYVDRHENYFVDFDNDGDLDLFQCGGGGFGTAPEAAFSLYNRLYENKDGKLVDIAASLNIDQPLIRSHTMKWFDYNNDGLLDVFLGGPLRDDKTWLPTIFKQTTQGFVEVGDQVGFTFVDGDGEPGKFMMQSDLNGDGHFELIPIRDGRIYDTRTTPWTLVTEDFTSEILKGEDAVFADFTGNLLPDAVITKASGKTKFYRNDNGRIVVDKTQEFDEILPGANGIIAGDFDNDMDLDLFIVGALIGTTNNPDVLLLNDGSGEFSAVNNHGAEGVTTGAADGVAMADYDLDGFLDFVVGNGRYALEEDKPRPTQLFRNRAAQLGNNNHWIQIDLEGGPNVNRDAIGSRVFVTAGGKVQVREQQGGGHHKAQDSLLLHFGLGQNAAVDKIVVEWPDGTSQEVNNVTADRVVRITQSGDQAPDPGEDDTAVSLPVKHDDPAINYEGEWNIHSSDRHSTNKTDASASLNFVGSSVSLVGDISVYGGIADIFIDGAKVATVDFEGEYLRDVSVFRATGLGDGVHTLEVFVRGQGYTYIRRIEN